MGDEEAIETLRNMGFDAGQGVEAGKGEKEEMKKGVVGRKGQKLQDGVLPGGKHAVGKIQDRAKANKEKALKRNQRAEENLAKSREMDGKSEL